MEKLKQRKESLKRALEKRLATLIYTTYSEKFLKNKTKVLTENEGLRNHIAELNKSIAMLKRKTRRSVYIHMLLTSKLVEKLQHKKKMQELMREIREKSKEQEYIKEALEKRLAALEKNNQKTKVLTENEGLKNHITELNKQITEFKEQMKGGHSDGRKVKGERGEIKKERG